MDFSDTHSTQRTCLNGHVVDNEADAWGTELNAQPYCQSCGAATINECPACHGSLRGHHKYRPLEPDPKPDSYCVHCGKALPWTETRIEAVKEIAKHIDALTDEDRTTLSEILPDLVCSANTPRTEIGIVKMKKLLKKGGETFAEGTKRVLIDVVSETIKKVLFMF